MAAVMSSSSFDGGGHSGPEIGYRQQIAQLEAEFSEFKVSSRELEEELELELEEAERKQADLQNKIDRLMHEVGQWKSKYLELQREYGATQQSLQKRIGALEEAHRDANNRIREMEMENDDMERHERIAKSSLSELEQKYHKALEEVAMLEAELSGKDELKIDLQRTKDELNETQEELARVNRCIKSENRAPGEGGANRVGSHLKGSCRSESSGAKSAAVPAAIAGIEQEKENFSSRTPSGMSMYSEGRPRRHPLDRSRVPMSSLASSKSLRKIHGMLDQMRSLETRVATFKSSLPRSVTPTPHIISNNTSTLASSSSISSTNTPNRMNSSNSGNSTSNPRRSVTPTQHRRSVTPTQRARTPSQSSPHPNHQHNRSMTPTQFYHQTQSSMTRSRTPSTSGAAGMPLPSFARRSSESLPRAKTPLSETSASGTSIPVWSQRTSAMGGYVSPARTFDRSALAADLSERRHRRREMSLSTLQASAMSYSHPSAGSGNGAVGANLDPIPGSPAIGSASPILRARAHMSVRSIGSRSQLLHHNAVPQRAGTPEQEYRPSSAFSQLQRPGIGHGRAV